MYKLTATADARLDNIKDETLSNKLKVIATGDVVNCSDAEYLHLERSGLIDGTSLAGIYGTPACFTAQYLGGSGGGGNDPITTNTLSYNSGTLSSTVANSGSVNVDLPFSGEELEIAQGNAKPVKKYIDEAITDLKALIDGKVQPTIASAFISIDNINRTNILNLQAFSSKNYIVVCGSLEAGSMFTPIMWTTQDTKTWLNWSPLGELAEMAYDDPHWIGNTQAFMAGYSYAVFALKVAPNTTTGAFNQDDIVDIKIVKTPEAPIDLTELMSGTTSREGNAGDWDTNIGDYKLFHMARIQQENLNNDVWGYKVKLELNIYNQTGVCDATNTCVSGSAFVFIELNNFGSSIDVESRSIRDINSDMNQVNGNSPLIITRGKVAGKNVIDIWWYKHKVRDFDDNMDYVNIQNVSVVPMSNADDHVIFDTQYKNQRVADTYLANPTVFNVFQHTPLGNVLGTMCSDYTNGVENKIILWNNSPIVYNGTFPQDRLPQVYNIVDSVNVDLSQDLDNDRWKYFYIEEQTMFSDSTPLLIRYGLSFQSPNTDGKEWSVDWCVKHSLDNGLTWIDDHTDQSGNWGYSYGDGTGTWNIGAFNGRNVTIDNSDGSLSETFTLQLDFDGVGRFTFLGGRTVVESGEV